MHAACMLHAACMDRHAWTGMHEPACMLLQQLLLLRATVRACVVARLIDTMYHYRLIYSSAQTRAWRIEFSYRNIRKYKGRSKGRVRAAASRARPFDRA
jgi:hypothetical protein